MQVLPIVGNANSIDGQAKVERESEAKTTNYEEERDAKGGAGKDNRSKTKNHDGGLQQR